ncbi:hypothetical protein ACU8MT_15710 [Rhizobium leguminosarum]
MGKSKQKWPAVKRAICDLLSLLGIRLRDAVDGDRTREIDVDLRAGNLDKCRRCSACLKPPIDNVIGHLDESLRVELEQRSHSLLKITDDATSDRVECIPLALMLTAILFDQLLNFR